MFINDFASDIEFNRSYFDDFYAKPIVTVIIC